MNTNKNKNASHLTHEMKNEHGGLAETGMKADTQPIFKALWGIAQELAFFIIKIPAILSRYQILQPLYCC